MTVTDPYEPIPAVRLRHPEWSRNATIYQINTRQFSPEGTLSAAAAQLPRLAELGVVVIWLMPIHPVGQVNRKGTLGSPYAVADYYRVDPALGTEADLRDFVDRAHGLGLKVILDWVANHTAWDNDLVDAHPEWYYKDWKGDFSPSPWWDWDDIIDLDYSHPALRRYMTQAMKYWVEQVDVDGFRCDVAGFVPVDFWENVRVELDRIKPVFMLAEWETRDLHTRAFDMTYAWSWNTIVHEIANGITDLGPLLVYYSWNEKAFPADAMRMTFVSNHDMNSWVGTEYERFGDSLDAAIVLSVVGAGFPLIYNGQEAGNRRRLEFFEKDPIEWRPDPQGELYRRLFALKRATTALDNGAWGAPMIDMRNSDRQRVLSFVRRDSACKVFAVFNFAATPTSVSFADDLCRDRYVDFDTGRVMVVDASTTIDLPPWGYRVLVR